MEALSRKIVKPQSNKITKRKETLRLQVLARNEHSRHKRGLQYARNLSNAFVIEESYKSHL